MDILSTRVLTVGGLSAALALAAIGLAPAPVAREEAASVAIPGPGPAIGSYLAGRFAQHVDDWSAAAGFMADALARDPDEQSLVRRTLVLALGDGRYEEALALARRYGAEGPESPLPTLLLIAADGRDGAIADALARLPHLPGTSGTLQFLRPLLTAWLLAGNRETDAALTALAPLRQIQGLEPWYYLHRGLITALVGDTAAADEAFRQAEENTGESLRVTEALSWYRNRPAAQTFTAREGLAEAFFDVANALQQEGSHESALLFGRLSLFIAPALSLPKLLIGDVLAARQRHEEALPFYRAAADENPRLSLTARLRLADSLHNLKRIDDGIVELEALARDFPESVDTLTLLGDHYRVAKRFPQAVTVYTRALALLPDTSPSRWTIHYGRALAYDRSGEWPKAEADLLAALQGNPEYPIVLNYLGYTWADKGLHLDKAREMVASAVAQRPQDGYIIDSLGWVLFRQGDLKGAVEHLERAIELKPLDPTINDHLGDAFWATGRETEAVFQWRRALQYAVDEPELKAAIERKLAERVLGPLAGRHTGAPTP